MTSTKNICYNVSDFDVNDNFPQLKTDEIITSQITDQCGNVVVTLPCSKEDCISENECCSNPTTIYGNLNVVPEQSGTACGSGNITVNKVIANTLQGNGSLITNTDDTQITNFQYNSQLDRLEIETLNPNNDIQKMFTVPTDIFTKNTKILSFGWDQQNSNIITLKDSDNNVWKIDLSKFDDSNDEIYITNGTCDLYGNLQLGYNKPELTKVNIDISKAIQNLDKYVTGGYLNNETLVLTRKNDTPININLYGLIAGIKCNQDIHIACVNWCGNDLIIKETDGTEYIINFTHIVDQVIDELKPDLIVSGCVTSDNEIILNRMDGNNFIVGKVKDTNTILERSLWKPNPLSPDDPKKLILSLINSDDSRIDINFSDLINRIPCNNTYVQSGEIREYFVNGVKKWLIQLTNNDNTKVEIDGLINSDTKTISGFYNYYDKQLILNQSSGLPVKVDLTNLIQSCTNQNDKYLKEATLLGNDILTLQVEGAPTLYVPLSKFQNKDQSNKTLNFNPEYGTLTLTDYKLDGTINTLTTNIFKKTDFKYISQIKILEGTNKLFVKQENGQTWTIDLPADKSTILKNSSNYNSNNGTLTLIHQTGDQIIITGLPKNNKVNSTITLNSTNWDGTVNYYVSGNSVMVNLNIIKGITPNLLIGQITNLSLPFDITKYLIGINNGIPIPVPVKISMDGIISLTTIVPDSIEDSVTFLVK